MKSRAIAKNEGMKERGDADDVVNVAGRHSPGPRITDRFLGLVGNPTRTVVLG